MVIYSSTITRTTEELKFKKKKKKKIDILIIVSRPYKITKYW